MARLNPELWKEACPYLDQALSLSGERRAEWLAGLRSSKPELAATVEELLREHEAAAQEGFLENNPSLPPLHPASAADIIGAYRLVSPIGYGGMGTVWLAERADGRFDRKVAIKFPHIALGGYSGEQRFKREGSIVGRLSHPHIAELVDAGVAANGQPYLVLEYVDGEPIDKYCNDRQLAVATRIRLFLDVLSAVAHAHTHLVVHRDIKPSNVLVDADGKVKLLDFGIAKLLEEHGQGGKATLLTEQGGPALTPEYAAPEQITGAPVTTATDVYGLGVLLYMLLTGQHPAGPGPHSPADMVQAILESEPPLLADATTSRASTPVGSVATRAVALLGIHRQRAGDLDTILAKALRKNPLERYVSVAAFAEDLERYLADQPIRARPDSLTYRALKFVRRNRAAVALVSLVILAIAGGIIGTLLQARAAREQRDFSIGQLARAEAINDLNAFLLSDAAPAGRPFTARDLLTRAELMIERRQQEDEAEHVRLLTSVGDEYKDLSENASARRVLMDAYRMSRHLKDPAVRSRASCALAGVLTYTDDQLRSEALFQEGIAELGSDPRFVLDRTYCLLRGAEIARERSFSEEALARVQAAQQLLSQSPVRPQSMELRVLIDLAESYRIAGRGQDAIAAFQLASARLTAAGRGDTATAAVLFDSWALVLAGEGRFREAEPIYRRAIEISRSDTAEHGVGRWLLRDYAVTLLNLGKLDEAANYSERAYTRAVEQGETTMAYTALLQRSRIDLQKGDLDRAEATLAFLEPRFQNAFAPDNYLVAVVHAQKGLLARARGDLPTALAFINSAVTMLESSVKAGNRGYEHLPETLVYRSEIQLQIGHSTEAVADARKAVDILRTNIPPGTFSAYIGRAYLALGYALQARGERSGARSAFASAAEHLQQALGPDCPDTVNARLVAAE